MADRDPMRLGLSFWARVQLDPAKQRGGNGAIGFMLLAIPVAASFNWLNPTRKQQAFTAHPGQSSAHINSWLDGDSFHLYTINCLRFAAPHKLLFFDFQRTGQLLQQSVLTLLVWLETDCKQSAVGKLS